MLAVCKITQCDFDWEFSTRTQICPRWLKTLLPATKKIKEKQLKQGETWFSGATLHRMTWGTLRRFRKEQPCSMNLFLCWLTVSLGKSFQLSAHQLAAFPPVPPNWSSQGSSWNLGTSYKGKKEPLEFPYNTLLTSRVLLLQHLALCGLRPWPGLQHTRVTCN